MSDAAVAPRPMTAADTAETERAATRAFGILCIGHLLLWTLIPSLMYQTVPHDSLEGIVWGRQWMLGYDKHPFLAPWISAGITDLFGTVGWPIYLASQLSVALCFWAVWMLARSLLDPWRAFVAVALLEGINYYNVCSFTFSPNMAMLATWPMLTLAVHQAVTRPALWRWLHAGLWAGLALLAKYESVVLFTALLVPLLATERGRLSLRTPAPYAGAALALLVASPNLVWLAQHDFMSLRYAGGTLALNGAPTDGGIWKIYAPLKFLLQQLGALAPLLLLFLLLRGRGPVRMDLRDFDQAYVMAVALGPLLVALLIGVVTGARLYIHWAIPFFSFLGVALVMFLPPQLTRARLLRFGAGLATLTLLLAGGLYWVIFVRPYHTGRPPFSITFPSSTLATHVTDEWHQRFDRPLAWVAGDRYLVAGVSAYSKDRPAPFFDHDETNNPWWNESSMREHGAAVVVQIDGAAAEASALQILRSRYPGLEQSESISLPQLSAAPLPPVRFLIGYLPPHGPSGHD